MVAPTINIEYVSRDVIGRVSGLDSSLVSFSTNQDLMEWEARAGGQGVGQGLLVGVERQAIEDGYALKLKNPWDETMLNYGPNWNEYGYETFNSVSYGSAVFTVEDEELTAGDRTYQINVYGKNESGEWTSYGG